MTQYRSNQKELLTLVEGDRVVAFDFGDHGVVTKGNYVEIYKTLCCVRFDDTPLWKGERDCVYQVSRLELETPLHQLANIYAEPENAGDL